MVTYYTLAHGTSVGSYNLHQTLLQFYVVELPSKAYCEDELSAEELTAWQQCQVPSFSRDCGILWIKGSIAMFSSE